MDYRTFIKIARSFARQYISPMEDGYCLCNNMQYCDWHLAGSIYEEERQNLIKRTENELKKAHKKQKDKNKQIAILEFSLLFLDLNFLSDGVIKHKKHAFLEKLKPIDEKLAAQFEGYLQEVISDNPFPTMRYRELTDKEWAILNSEDLSELFIVYQIAEEGEFDFFDFEKMPYREFVLHCLDFMRHYVISLSNSCAELYRYLDIAKGYLDGQINRNELHQYSKEIWATIDKIEKTTPLHIVYIYKTTSYFLWFAFLDNDEEEGQQDPSYSYFLDDLRQVQYGLVVQLFMPIFERLGLVESE